MALDVGDRRIGIALSDESASIALPRETLTRSGTRKDVEEILELAEREGVSEILVGIPLTLEGTEGPQASKVMQFMQVLREHSPLPVTPWDERLTTVTAQRSLIEGGVSRARRRKVIDKVAAAVLLQSYLDYRSQKEALEGAG